MTGLAARALAGAVAGATATVPMSAWMVALERLGAMRGLPPEAIVRGTTAAEGERSVGALAAASHLVYGLALGAGLLALRRRA